VKYPVVIKDTLSRRDFLSLSHHLNWEGWLRTNVDDKPNAPVSWTKHDLTPLIFYKVATTFQLKLKRFLECDLSVVKIHVNGQTMGQLSSFHKDFYLDNVWTTVLFTNDDWNVNYGGEFTLYNPESGEYESVSYIPNTSVTFPSNWEHKGACPLVPDAGIRTSLAISFCRRVDLDAFLEAYPGNSRFALR